MPPIGSRNSRTAEAWNSSCRNDIQLGKRVTAGAYCSLRTRWDALSAARLPASRRMMTSRSCVLSLMLTREIKWSLVIGLESSCIIRLRKFWSLKISNWVRSFAVQIFFDCIWSSELNNLVPRNFCPSPPNSISYQFESLLASHKRLKYLMDPPNSLSEFSKLLKCTGCT